MNKLVSHPRTARVVLAAGMALAGLAAHAAERALEKSVEVAATLDEAWDAWTTEKGIVSFMAPGANVQARVDGLFEIYFDPLAQPGDRGADGMRFLAIQPRRMISFTWNAPPHLPEARQQRTVVIVRFEPVGERVVRVSLHHTGWGDGGEWDKAYAYFDRAWGNVLGGMKTRFESGPKDWSEWLAQLKKMHDTPVKP